MDNFADYDSILGKLISTMGSGSFPCAFETRSVTHFNRQLLEKTFTSPSQTIQPIAFSDIYRFPALNFYHPEEHRQDSLARG